jgi:RNA polymerase sigma-70 factor, ECF subfamily
MSDLAHPARGRPDPGAAGALLARLFEEHGRTVYGLCRLLLRDADEAEDAAQQTFLSAYRAVGSGVVPRDGGAWLATIARNECRNRVRTRMREPLVLEAQFLATTESLDDAFARSEQIAELKAALLDLPEKQREAVLLRDVYGLGYREIAAALGATRPSVEALLFRARRRLQGRLRPLRDAAAALLVPPPLRDALAEAIPGFATGGGGAAAGAAAGVTAAKLAAATLLVGGAGTTVAVVGSSERRHYVPKPPAAVATVASPVRDPPERVAVPVATRVEPNPPRDAPKARVARATAAVAAARDDDHEDDGEEKAEQDERRGRSNGPGPASEPTAHGRGHDADDADEKKSDRSGPSAKDDDDAAPDHGDDEDKAADEDRDEDEDEDDEGAGGGDD